MSATYTAYNWVTSQGGLGLQVTLDQSSVQSSGSNRGATKVNYTITCIDNAGGQYSRQEGNTWYIQLGGEKISISGKFYGGRTITGTFSTLFSRGTDGYLNLSLSFYYYNSVSSTGAEIKGSGTYRGDYYAMYTACGAPTSVTITGATNKGNNIIIPKDTLTITWSGASSGIANSISSYYIGYTINGTTKYVEVSSTATSGSCSITMSDAADRGSTISCSVQTRGGAGSSYYSSTKSGDNTLKINTLPTAPTLTAVASTVTSSTSTGTVNITSGTDSDSSQTVTTKLWTSLDSTYRDPSSNTFTSSLGAQGSTTTFYAISWDGLEYGDTFVQVDIKRNIAPTISVKSNSSTLGDSFQMYTSSSAYTTYYGSDTPVLTFNKSSGTLTRYMYYNGTRYTLSSSKVTGTSSSGSYIYTNDKLSVNQLISSQGITYDSSKANTVYFGFNFNDGIETTSIVTTTSITIPSVSSVQNKYNQFSSSNISKTTDGHMWKQIRVQIYNDTSMKNVNVSVAQTVNSNTSSIGVSFSTSTTNGYKNIDIQLSSAPASAATLTFNITLSDGYITKTVPSFSMTAVKTVSFSNFTLGGSSSLTVYPFTTTSTLTASCGHTFSSTSTSTVNTDYELDLSALKLIYTSTNLSNTLSINPTLSDSTMTSSVTAASLMKWSESTYSGTISVTAYLQLSNYYGETFTSNSITIIFNFNEKASITGNLTAKYKYGSNSFADFTTKITQQNMTLQFNATLQVYTKDSITVELLRNDSVVATKVYSTSSLTYATTNSPVNNSISIEYGPLAEITADNKSETWKIRVTNTRGSNTSSAYGTYAIKHTTPTSLVFKSCTYSGSNTFAYKYSIGDDGTTSNTSVTKTVTTYLCDIANNISSSAITATSGNATIAESDWTSVTIYVKVVSAITVNGYTNTKTYYSNGIAVYNNVPTISYRPNSIGINTELSSNSDAIVAIQNYTGKNKVYLLGAHDSAYIMIEDQDESTNIFIDNFIIDGGVISEIQTN